MNMKLTFEIETKKNAENVALDVKFALVGNPSGGGDIHGGFSITGNAAEMAPRVLRGAEMLQTYMPEVARYLSEDHEPSPFFKTEEKPS
jgi:hypothetical protein